MDRKFITLVCLSVALCVNAIDVKTYYSSLEGKSGQNLINAIMALTQNHTVLSYNNVRADKTNVDYTSEGYIWDMYSNCHFASSDYCSGTEFTDCQCYNREHSLPKSWWGGSQDEPMYTDLHHVIPTDGNANTQRSAWAFDNVKSNAIKWQNSAGAKLGTGMHLSGTVFEVPDQYKGDFARIYFYMLCCYNNKNFASGGKGSQYFTYSNGKAAFTNTASKILVLWADGDPVSEKEINRNNKVEKKQGNRNAFVDLPDLYQYLWGSKKNQAYHLPTALDIPEEYTYTVTTDQLTMTVTTTTEDMLVVYNMLGTVVYMQPVQAQETQIQLPQAGIYLVRMGNQTRKVQVGY